MLDLLKKQDWVLSAAIAVLSAASLVILYSINVEFFWRQLIWLIISFVVIFGFVAVEWRSLLTYRWLITVIYLAAVFLLVITLIAAPTIRSAQSWIVIGSIRIQTSEFAKVALILLLSYFFARGHIGIGHWRILAKSFVYFVIPAILILLQPDLGTTLILSAIWISFLLVSGIRWRHIAIGLGVTAVVTIIAWNYFLQDYHKERIKGLFNPEYDPLGINYGVIQSKIAIGSAGFWGKGFQQGTQVQLGFLPEAQSDFIFSAFVEEWGIFGGLVILAAFSSLLFRLIKIGLAAENNLLRLLSLGTVMVMLAHFIFNIGSGLGLLPVVGVPFPFLSYGGSNILANAFLIGIIQSLVARSTFLKEHELYA